MSDDNEMRMNPEAVANLLGRFDVHSYENDLVDFPDHFDENGWPLFGIYDPYTLEHPITGLSWHLAPRVPTDDESDPAYEVWFSLAQQYETTMAKIAIQQKNAPYLKPLTDPSDGNAFFRQATVQAAAGNLAYLLKHVLPYIEENLERRFLSAEFVLSWGEFRQIGENLDISFNVERMRHHGRIAGARNKMNRSPQLKWYLHWHRYHVEQRGLTRRKVNEMFVTFAWRIYNGEAPLPDGFDKAWFSNALGRGNKREGLDTVTRKLPDKLLRAYKDPQLVHKLLASDAAEIPKIPPIDP